MKRISQLMVVAGALALAGGVAQAQTFNSPTIAGEASTMTNGQPNVRTEHDAPMYLYTVPYTAVMGAGPAVVYGYSYPAYILPSPHLRSGASETSNVPQRAGEASTMTNGAPNLVTTN
jgi:hypothetical protein